MKVTRKHAKRFTIGPAWLTIPCKPGKSRVPLFVTKVDRKRGIVELSDERRGKR